MAIEEPLSTLEETMVSPKTLVADTGHPEKTVQDPEHGTRTPENKETPRTITGWKVSARLISSRTYYQRTL